MLDCGADWLGRVARLRPSAIVLTHAHPDHAGGLADGAPCPVYATAETWGRIGRYPIAERRIIEAVTVSALAPSPGRHSTWSTPSVLPRWAIGLRSDGRCCSMPPTWQQLAIKRMRSAA